MDNVKENKYHETHANERRLHELNELENVKENESHDTHANERRLHELNEMDNVKENESHETHANERRFHELNELENVTENESHETHELERTSHEMEQMANVKKNESHETHELERTSHELNEMENVTQNESNESHELERTSHEMHQLDNVKENESHETHELERPTHELDQLDNVKGIESHETHELERTTHEMRPHHDAMETYSLTHKSLRLNSDILHGQDEIRTLLQHYGRNRNGLILMLRDFSTERKDDDSERNIDAAQKTVLNDLLTLELDEQRNHDLELSQLDDDILQQINSTTEAIIDDFERVDSTGSAASSVHEFNCDYYQEPPDSPEDDLLENTDTEDGTEEVMDLIQSNMRLMSALDRQRATIARLKARIFRMGDLVKNLTDQLEIIRGNGIDRPPRDTTDINALVLVDANFDTSFLLQPNQDGDERTNHHYHPQLKQDLAMQLAKINAMKRNSQEELWMYFDSGASRSVITETSPIRKRLQSITPAYGSCSIGDGTPL